MASAAASRLPQHVSATQAVMIVALCAALNVFGGFVVMLLGAGAATGVLAILPFAMTIGLYALELLVAFLQAYVFAMLTCMYLNDALHPGGH